MWTEQERDMLRTKLHSIVIAGLVVGAVALPFTGFAKGNNNNGESEGTPFPTGGYSIRDNGSFTDCLNPTTFAVEACTTSGTLVYPLTVVAVGSGTRDRQGNFCETETGVYSALPPNTTAASAAPGTTAGKVTGFDSSTGQFDESFTGYTGGQCNGSHFDSSGATETGTGTAHFVVTGTRADFIITSFTSAPLTNVESYSLAGYELMQ